VLAADLEKTKADNVKLYGKIRYVQDYNLEKVVSRGSKKVPHCISIFISISLFCFLCSILLMLYDHFQHAEDLESGFASDVESKYKKIYEDDINPFAAFSKKVVFFEHIC
jgi:homeobox protein cut-like